MNEAMTPGRRATDDPLGHSAAPSAPPDDQATRLRALMETLGRAAPVRPSAIAGLRGAQPPAYSPGPDVRHNPPAPIRHRSDLFSRRARLIAFSSGKGGVGKTNSCVNLAIALSALGKRTTLVDADLGLANADVLCGLSPTKRLEHVVGSAASQPLNGSHPPSKSTARLAPIPPGMREIAVDAPGGFRLVPGAAGIARMADLKQDQRVRLLTGIAELERDCDLVLVDTAAGLGRDCLTFMQTADLGIVVATPEPTSITDAYALIKCTLTERPIAQRAHHLRVENGAAAPRARLALLVNQVVDEREAAAVHARIAGACARFLGYQLPLLGWIAQDARVAAAVRKRNPVLLDAPRSRASEDIRRVAKAIAKAVEPERTGPKPRRRGITRLLARMVLRNR